MMNVTVGRPDDTEHHQYYGRYVALVPEGNILAVLGQQLAETLALLREIPEALGTHRYALGKWSIKELLGHMIDTERVFAYRALRFARGDETPLPGFEQDDYVARAAFDDYPLSELAEEFEAVRRATILLFRHLPAEAWTRRGTASENEVSVRALAYIIAGHERHHRDILSARYLAPETAQGESPQVS